MICRICKSSAFTRVLSYRIARWGKTLCEGYWHCSDCGENLWKKDFFGMDPDDLDA